ncbi:hypothetical protein HD597_003718 [Nonomuraea thailandensis]|uniref:Uncharacterized protein n=1 Tax=Nonomuraea thailandensis TaxID=1188745 RepID=A0A9X2GLZ3_9ACTN|nr:hypothetical protein [Nonomuraea thailandensis]MCP2356698.1 hypothetical protein [Nonomuraea thailandensis]
MTANRKIVAGRLFISLDGVVEAPERWHFPYLNDEMSAAVWPHQTGELADQLNTMAAGGGSSPGTPARCPSSSPDPPCSPPA